MTLRKLAELDENHIEDLHQLYQQEWWTKDRERAGIKSMLEETDLVVAFSEDDSDELIGFARVLTDQTYKALILDVIVAADHRDTGLGERLMTEILNHPDLQDVEHFELYCLPEMIPFYEQWGFTDDLGDLTLMRHDEPSL